jgi:hypothetical protein
MPMKIGAPPLAAMRATAGLIGGLSTASRLRSRAFMAAAAGGAELGRGRGRTTAAVGR